jgi:hypothetical protein
MAQVEGSGTAATDLKNFAASYAKIYSSRTCTGSATGERSAAVEGDCGGAWYCCIPGRERGKLNNTSLCCIGRNQTEENGRRNQTTLTCLTPHKTQQLGQ